MKFRDRRHAGILLAEALTDYRDKDPLILAVPRGGVEVGVEVAKHLDCDFDLIVVRKLPFPDNPESGFGAIAEDGSSVVFERLAATVPEAVRARIHEEQQTQIRKRIEALRKGRPISSMGNRTVILIDDGIAVGSTMQAAVAMCRNQHAARIVVAAPVSSEKARQQFASLADAAVVLATPSFFQAVAQVYQNWYDVSDEEVLHLLETRQ